MNRKQMQEWLDQFPEEAEIEVVVADDGAGFMGITTSEVPFDGTYDTCDFTDLRDNPNIPPDAPHYRKCVIVLGARE